MSEPSQVAGGERELPAAVVATPATTARKPFQYTVIRVVPSVEREEFINVGVVLFCRTGGFLGARTRLDRERLRALSTQTDVDAVCAQLATYERVAAGDPAGGRVALLSPSERYHWLAAPASTVVQTSQTHTGLSADPERTLAELFERLVR